MCAATDGAATARAATAGPGAATALACAATGAATGAANAGAATGAVCVSTGRTLPHVPNANDKGTTRGGGRRGKYKEATGRGNLL